MYTLNGMTFRAPPCICHFTQKPVFLILSRQWQCWCISMQRESTMKGISLSLSREHNSSHLVNAAPAVWYCFRNHGISLRKTGKERWHKGEDVADLEIKPLSNKFGIVYRRWNARLLCSVTVPRALKFVKVFEIRLWEKGSIWNRTAIPRLSNP